jgi:hypothetical protein
LFDHFVSNFKTKITAGCRDSCEANGKLRRLRQGPNAARAQGFANQPPVFQYGNLLQVGAKGAAGSTLGEAAVVTKCRGFTTSIALCHCQNPFVIIAKGKAASAAGE